MKNDLFASRPFCFTMELSIIHLEIHSHDGFLDECYHLVIVPSEIKIKLNLKTTPLCVSKHKQHNGRSSQIYLMIKKSHSLQTHQRFENDAIVMKVKLQN